MGDPISLRKSRLPSCPKRGLRSAPHTGIAAVVRRAPIEHGSSSHVRPCPAGSGSLQGTNKGTEPVGERWLSGRPHLHRSPRALDDHSASVIVMPALARTKQQTGRRLGSRALQAGAVETWVCAYFSLAVLAGVGAEPCIRLVVGRPGRRDRHAAGDRLAGMRDAGGGAGSYASRSTALGESGDPRSPEHTGPERSGFLSARRGSNPKHLAWEA